MDPISTAVKKAKEIETLLAENFEAEGKGLHQKITSAGPYLPVEMQKKLRWIATIRNKMVHEEGFEDEFLKLQDFVSTSDRLIAELERMSVYDRTSRHPEYTDRAYISTARRSGGASASVALVVLVLGGLLSIGAWFVTSIAALVGSF